MLESPHKFFKLIELQ